VANVKQLMLDLIHPSSNDILLAIYRGGPKDEKDWAAVAGSIDASCTTCHKQYRPNVFPPTVVSKDGGSK